jgi:hypothetical protein
LSSKIFHTCAVKGTGKGDQLDLFSSYAYGRPREERYPRGPSDLDLYVLLKDDVAKLEA